MANNDLTVIFPDGNIVHTDHDQCSCANSVDVQIRNLIIGKKYTVFIDNLNDTPVTLFPESFSFVANQSEKKLTFNYQFV